MSGKKCSSLDDLIREGKALSERKRAEIRSAFNTHKGQVFIQPQNINVTPDAVKQICEDSTTGPAVLAYVAALAHGKKKYNEWEDLASVVKRLHHVGRDPLGILKEGAVPEKKAPPKEEVVEMDHGELDSVMQYLLSDECKLLTSKKGLNDMLIMWLMREGRGYQFTMRHLRHMNKIGCQFSSIRELTTSIRRANRVMDEMKTFLSGEGKSLVSGFTGTPEQLFSIYETGGASTFTVGFLQQLQKEGKRFASPDALAAAVDSLKTNAYDQLMEFFADIECTLLNVVDNISDAKLSELLVAGPGVANALKHLHALNDSQRTFLNITDLIGAIHTRSGVPVLIL
jgi:hypothetical protein